MGLVKTRRLAAMQKQQRAKAGMKPADGKAVPSTPRPSKHAWSVPPQEDERIMR